MMGRKYARRTRCGGAATGTGVSHSDPVLLDSGGDDEGEDCCSDEDFVDLTSSSSQSLPHEIPFHLRTPALSWPLEPLPSEDFSSFEERKARKKRPSEWRRGSEREAAATGTTTLMEAQEFGEMMEHVDAVNFALDGLRRGQPARTRRTSLLSLLSICETPAQRRLLRAQGITSRIINAILGLGFDDSPSTIAAAALFYVLSTDVQDDDLLESSSCIHFLIKLLNPPVVDSVQKAPTVGSKLLGMHKPHMLDARKKAIDSSAKSISSRVNEILSSCKEIKSTSEDIEALERPELSSKLIALLTMEKACLSTVSFEDRSDIVKSVGRRFKERLRELGGLDAIFDVLTSCHSTLEACYKSSSVSLSFVKDESVVHSMMLLLKCLKIMENATFLSQDNQDHLLEMKCKINADAISLSFVGVIVSVINLFSEISFLSTPSDGKSAVPEVNNCQTMHTFRDNNDEASTSNCSKYSGFDEPYGIKSFTIGHKRQKRSSSKSEVSTCPSVTMDYHCSAPCHGLLNSSFSRKFNDGNILEAEKDRSGSRVRSVKLSKRWISLNTNGSNRNMDGVTRKSRMSKDVKGDSQINICDPFAFDECEFEPSKWELLENKKEKSLSHDVSLTNRELPNGCQFPNATPDDALSQLTSEENCSPREKNWMPVADEDSNLLEDCLLTSVKVLMNLTNDNPVGCQKIAACGGLDAMVSLIARHFPSLDLCFPMDSELKGKAVFDNRNHDDLKHKRLRDHDIDFLVAILGLLVNLVEKDSHNRLCLATARVSINRPGNTKINGAQKDVIPLLCSVFLTNQENREVVDGRLLQCDDEDSLLQGEREAEMMIIEAYAALLLAFLSTESMQIRQAIAKCLPNENLQVLVPVLEKFVAFHLKLNMIPLETHSAVVQVIESCKGP